MEASSSTPERPAPEPSLYDSLQTLARLVTQMASTRLRLGRVGEREARRRVVRSVLLAALGLLGLFLALIFASVAVLVLLWDTHRVAAALGLPIAYLLLTALAAWGAASSAKRAPRAFAATLETLRADRDQVFGPPDHGSAQP
jgi:uncharacterized membrane protein YqjE